MTMTNDKQQPVLYDVVIYELATGIVSAVVGERMHMTGRFYSALKRKETAEERCNEGYAARIVLTGTVGVGGKVPEREWTP